MRGISVLFQNDADTPIGVMCVNLASSAFDQARVTLEFLARGFRVKLRHPGRRALPARVETHESTAARRR